MQIGRYRVEREVARGGMGEVYLAHDPTCRRDVALKKIRDDLKGKSLFRQRFLREAWVTGRLSHPGVIPVYEISHDDLYYTMPYVEGETLKEILKSAIDRPGDYPIPHLARIFTSVCDIIAYAHQQGILHRDLKPENIMVGSFGEVYVLDWGLAKWGEDLPSSEEEEVAPELTQPGKVFGTLHYLAPECASGSSTSVQSDIYALGVILYQLLSLRVPFKRASLSEFKKGLADEKWVSPAKMAPLRNVPKMLSRIARRCLRKDPQERYTGVGELLHDLRNYLEGRSEWFPIAALDQNKEEHWALHENVHLNPSWALTRTIEGSEWVSLMVSRDPFPGNVALRGRVKIGQNGSGLGLLVHVPDQIDPGMPNGGLCLWLGSDLNPGATLLRNDLQVYAEPDIVLERGQWHTFQIEYVDNNLYLSIDGVRRLSYIGYLPLAGSRVGLLYRDADFSLEEMQVLVGSYSIRINCLALPDAFLAERLYSKALLEYRRIADAFPERDEGREALFRAGITLLEQQDYDGALDEFAKLHHTAAAPLEYLGKALVYQAQGDFEEEGKCFELAFRRYRDHPLLTTLRDHLLYRLHESSRTDRKSSYRFALFLCRYFDLENRLLNRLQDNWEPLPFLPPPLTDQPRLDMALRLAFWLAKPLVLEEIAEEEPQLARHAAWALLELGCSPTLELDGEEEEALQVAQGGEITRFDGPFLRAVHHRMQRALDSHQFAEIYTLYNEAPYKESFNSYLLWALLYERRREEAEAVIEQYPLERLSQENDLLHFLYGAYLALTEGEEIAQVHFSGVLESPFPRTWALYGHYSTDRITQRAEWERQAFVWEKRQLHRQRALMAHLYGQPDEERRALADLQATFPSA